MEEQTPQEQPENNIKSASPLLAFFLTVVTPPIGGTYATNSFRGGMFYFFVGSIPFSMFFIYALTDLIAFIAGFFVLSFGINISLAIRASREARREKVRSGVFWNIVKVIGLGVLVGGVLNQLRPTKVYKIVSTSMAPNFTPGDRIIVTTFSYGLWSPIMEKKLLMGGGPKRGDVVVFVYPSNKAKHYIKRIVGLPGDTIQVANGTLSINGKTIKAKPGQPYSYRERVLGTHYPPINTQMFEEDLFGVKFQTLRDKNMPSKLSNWDSKQDAKQGSRPWGPNVPKGHVFVMGDNRDHSSDSRDWGLVPMNEIVGKVKHILFTYHPEKGILWNRFFRTIQ